MQALPTMEMQTDALRWMRSVVEFDLLPTLAEYWFDAPDKLHRWEQNLRGVFNDD